MSPSEAAARAFHVHAPGWWPGILPFPEVALGEPVFGLTVREPFASSITTSAPPPVFVGELFPAADRPLVRRRITMPRMSTRLRRVLRLYNYGRAVRQGYDLGPFDPRDWV